MQEGRGSHDLDQPQTPFISHGDHFVSTLFARSPHLWLQSTHILIFEHDACWLKSRRSADEPEGGKKQRESRPMIDFDETTCTARGSPFAPRGACPRAPPKSAMIKVEPKRVVGWNQEK